MYSGENFSFPSTSAKLEDLKIFNPPQNGSKEPKPPSDIHPDVVCDICGCQVKGFRYKCMTCPNLDLCSDCERGGKHPEHNMIRISSMNKDSVDTHHQLFLIRNKFLVRALATNRTRKMLGTALPDKSTLLSVIRSTSKANKSDDPSITTPTECSKFSLGDLKQLPTTADLQSRMNALKYPTDVTSSTISDTDSSTESLASSSSITTADSLTSSLTSQNDYEQIIRPTDEEEWSYVMNSLHFNEDLSPDLVSNASSESFERIDVEP